MHATSLRPISLLISRQQAACIAFECVILFYRFASALVVQGSRFGESFVLLQFRPDSFSTCLEHVASSKLHQPSIVFMLFTRSREGFKSIDEQGHTGILEQLL